MAEVGAQLKLGVDATEYNKVVSEMPKKMESSMASIKRLLDMGAVAMGMQSVLSKMDDIADTATRLGASAEDVQRIGGAAKMVGSNLETVDRAVRAITIAAKQAAEKGGDAAEQFRQIGIDPEQFAGSTFAEKVQQLAAAQEAASVSAGKMAQYWDTIGARAGGIDFNAISDSMSGIAVASNATVEALAKANDELDKAKNAVTVFAAEGMSKFQKLIEDLTGGALNLVNLLTGNKFTPYGEFDKNGRLVMGKDGKYHNFETVFGYQAGTAKPGMPMGEQEDGAPAPSKIKIKDGSKSRASDAADDYERAKTGAAKRYEANLELKIREALLVKNQTIADALQYQLDLTRALTKYEGNYEMAVRSANAALSERNKDRSQQSASDANKAKEEMERSRREQKAAADEAARAEEEAKKEARERYLKDIHGNNIITQSRMSILKTAATSGRFGGDTDFEGMTHGYGDSVARGTNADLMRSNARIQKMQERVNEYSQRGAYGAAAALTDRMNTAAELQVNRMANRLENRINRNQEQIDSGRYSPQEAAVRTQKNIELRAALQATRNGNTDTMEKTVGDILAEIQKRLPITALG